jgi:hypothetical protein
MDERNWEGRSAAMSTPRSSTIMLEAAVNTHSKSDGVALRIAKRCPSPSVEAAINT